jgi:hypothetical protein
MSEREPMLQAKLSEIQQKLKAPKNQRNNFGNYEYRSCEDILNALKPLLGGAVILLADEIIQIGTRYYVKATATIMEGSESISIPAYAREEETKKGMDGAQVTGAASSYARKYALNGLFAIDDTKDSDTTNTHGKEKQASQPTPQPNRPAQAPSQPSEQRSFTPLTDKQRGMIFYNISRLKTTEDEVKAKFGFDHITSLSSSQASQIIDQLIKMQSWE